MTKEQDFTKPASNDASGCCVRCGRDNNGYLDDPCSEDCPMYWEDLGIPYPDGTKGKAHG